MIYYFAVEKESRQAIRGSYKGSHLYNSLDTMKRSFRQKDARGYFTAAEDYDVFKINTETMEVEPVGRGIDLFNGNL